MDREKDTCVGKKRFCCIGVGCDVINPSGWKQAVERSDMFDFEGKSGQPPDVFMEKTGFSIEFCSALMGLNDTLRFSFEQIADYVEGKINNGTAFRENK